MIRFLFYSITYFSFCFSFLSLDSCWSSFSAFVSFARSFCIMDFFFGGVSSCPRTPRNFHNVNAADDCLYFLLYRDGIEDRRIGNERHDPRADLCLYDRKLGSTHELRRLVNHDLRQSGLFSGMIFLSITSMETDCFAASICSC